MRGLANAPRELGVEVFGEDELVERIQRGEKHRRACISIGDPRPFFRKARIGERLHPAVKSSFESVLRLSFYDREQPVKIEGLHRSERVPELRDARRVLRFFEKTRDRTDGWTVHCWAGVSRSPATALALLFLLRGDEERAAEELRRIRPQAMPNLRLVRHFDALLGSRLIDAARNIYELRHEELISEFRENLDGSLEELEAADPE
jgi:predicted protein tyrosine phosphatase